MQVASFFGEYRFLSNFWPKVVSLADVSYPSVEHAYQAAKTMDPAIREKFTDRSMTPGQAKKLGRTFPLRPNWNKHRVQVMGYLLDQKFKDPELRQKLLDTGRMELIEGNTWGDVFWGVCDGVGENMLGKILMNIRDRIHLETLFDTVDPT